MPLLSHARESQIRTPQSLQVGQGKEAHRREARGRRRESLKADILFPKHVSSIIRQSPNPVCGSWKIQASYPWQKQHRAQIVPSWRNHIHGWMNV